MRESYGEGLANHTGPESCGAPREGKAGKWSCELPAARFDLAIAAAGFVPHYRFSQQVPVGKVRSTAATC
jgi:hypothetical protein